jgi:hypothetical protein
MLSRKGVVGERGLEPLRPRGHRILSAASKPIPPLPHHTGGYSDPRAKGNHPGVARLRTRQKLRRSIDSRFASRGSERGLRPGFGLRLDDGRKLWRAGSRRLSSRWERPVRGDEPHAKMLARMLDDERSAAAARIRPRSRAPEGKFGGVVQRLPQERSVLLDDVDGQSLTRRESFGVPIRFGPGDAARSGPALGESSRGACGGRRRQRTRDRGVHRP